jgi:hypothetical protein
VGPNSHFWASQGIEEPVVSPLAERTLPQEKDSSNIPKPSLPCPSTAKPLRNVTREKDSPEVLHKLIRKWNQTPEELKRKLYETPAVNRKGVELRNPYFYTSFFKHVFKGSAYFTVAHQAFQEAVDNNQINNIVCNEFINVAGKTGHYVEAKEAFDIAFERGCMDQWTINSFINIAGINNQWDDAGEAFTLACQKGLCDNVTGNTLIENAGKSKNFELAQRIFNRMLEMPGLADAFTFSSYIKTAGICHQFQECQRAYLLAKERAQEDDQILNSYVFNHFIFAASKCGKFNEAKIAYEEAVRAGHADTHVQNTYNIILINQKKRFSKY